METSLHRELKEFYCDDAAARVYRTGGGLPETMKGRPLFKSPLPRSYLSETSSVASAAVATFLASDGSEYMSGVVIPSCDGGSFARTSIPIPESWSLEQQVAP